jgi:maleylpyruvate isomerase
MTSVAHDTAAVAAATEDLFDTASRLSDEDLGAPSLCDGWTRGHVLAHLSRNADAISRLVDWAVTGKREEMYPGGQDARDAEIEAGAFRGAGEQLADLRQSAERLADRLPLLEGGTAVEAVEGRGGFVIPSEDLPFMRLREVVYHHVDLAAGYSFEQVSGELLTRFIADAVRRLSMSRRAPDLTLRTSEGEEWTVGEGGVSVTGTRAGLLLWLARRRADGVSADGPLPELPRGA